MGNHESSSTSEPVAAPVNIAIPHSRHYKELYADLTAPDGQDSPVKKEVFRGRFVRYFGGPCAVFGDALYAHLLPAEEIVAESAFLAAMVKLRQVCTNPDHHAIERLCFNVFSHHQECITKQDLTRLIHATAQYALMIGTELHEQAIVSPDHPLLSGLIQDAWVHVQSDSLTESAFSAWVVANCPGLLQGIQEWTLTRLTHTTETLRYQLPSPKANKVLSLQQQIDLSTLVWLLSTVVPMVYMGHTGRDEKDTDKVGLPVGGEWTSLYSSDQHGLSMNRFQHHCGDYRHPSVLSLTCYHRQQDTLYQFAIALDTEWRDGTYYYGGEKSLCVQLRPTFRPLKRGPKLVSLNEKQRGFPSGLRVLGNGGTPLLTVDPSLNTVTFLGEEGMSVECVEVWGCGGVEAVESQRRMKEWEKRQISLRGKVKREGLAEAWETDRYILEMGGVTTRRPTEQHQT